MRTSVYGNYLPYFIMGRVCTVNLLIDQNNILYLLLHEIICQDDENVLIGMCFGCWSDISVRFRFTDMPSRAVGPSTKWARFLDSCFFLELYFLHQNDILSTLGPFNCCDKMDQIDLINIRTK